MTPRRGEPRKRRVGPGRGSNLRNVPANRRCHESLPDGRRCSSWTVAIDGGRHDIYCVAHSHDPHIMSVREMATEVGRQALEAYNAQRRAQQARIFDGPLDTQDDVARALLALMMALEANTISAARASVADRVLSAMSTHIERYGMHQGAEGGLGVLRLLPGTTLVEMDTELDYVMTKAELEEIERRLAADERDGIATPTDFSEVVEKYLGKKVRGRDRTRAQLEGEGL